VSKNRRRGASRLNDCRERGAGIPLSGIRQHVTAEGRKPRGGFPLLSDLPAFSTAGTVNAGEETVNHVALRELEVD